MLKSVFFFTVISLCLAFGALINEPSRLSASAFCGWISATSAWVLITKELKYV